MTTLSLQKLSFLLVWLSVLLEVASSFSSSSCAFSFSSRPHASSPRVSTTHAHNNPRVRTTFTRLFAKESESLSEKDTTTVSLSLSPLLQARRGFLTLVVATTGTVAVSSPAHATRAVGGAELDCRAAGNCLERGEWDGAIGWTWGAKDRCEATDPTCGADGRQLRVDANGNILGQAVPSIVDSTSITDIALLRIDVGREESGVLKVGLFGKDCPASVEQFLSFLDDTGFQTRPDNNNALGELTSPVSLTRGGVATWVTPGASIEWGVPTQSLAYAKSRGSSKGIADSFVAQPRPKSTDVQNDLTTLSHQAADLLSVPLKGLGYGGTGFENDDECFERAFLLTNAPAVNLDKSRRVIGQLLDGPSMAFLERLANLPTKRGIRGVVANDGPPLPKVTIREIKVAKVVNSPSTSSL